MKNLEQIRATEAFVTARETTKATANRFPAMILTNGLIAATAFATEDGGQKRPRMHVIVGGIARHLSNPEMGFNTFAGCDTPAKFSTALHESADNSEIQRATVEALSFIAYVKRFAQKDEDNQED